MRFLSWKANRIRKKLERRFQEDYYFKRRILTTELRKCFSGKGCIPPDDLYASLNVGDYKIQAIVVQDVDKSGNINRRLDFKILIRNHLDEKWYFVNTIKGSKKYDFKNFELKLFEILWDYMTRNLIVFNQVKR